MPRAGVKERPKKKTGNTGAVAECQHHWYIATPAGSTSRGVCRRCGAEREFRNSTQDYVGDGDSGGTPWRGSRASKSISDDPDEISTAGAAAKASLVA